MNLRNKNTRDLASDIKTGYFPGFHSLPYNRFAADESPHFWLSPTSEKAAFPYAKMVFTTNEEWVDAGHVFCGFNVEKGVLHEADWPRKNLMDESWFWHRFLELANAPLLSVAEEAAKAIDGNLHIFMTAGIMTPGHDWANIRFEVEDSHLRRTAYQSGDGILQELSESTNFSELADSLRALNGDSTGWHWIDFHIGKTFTMDMAGPDDKEQCAAMLKPFEPWMIASAKR